MGQDTDRAEQGGVSSRVRTLLVTGAAGRVGTLLRPLLRERYRLVLLDRAPVTDRVPGESELTGDLLDNDLLERAVAASDFVLHLACVHGFSITFEETLDANYRATLALLDATARAGGRRFIYASSHHVLGAHTLEGFAGDAAALAPDAYYGLSKAFGEAACAMYAHRFGMKCLMIRIGNADPEVGDGRTARLWTSARDLANLVAIGCEHPDIGCDIVYGVSQCEDALFSNTRATELGYTPLDHAKDNLSAGYAPATGDHAGGQYVTTKLVGPGRQT